MVSLKKLIKGGIKQLTKENKLILKNQLFYLIKKKFG
jgi:hypothetical protein